MHRQDRAGGLPSSAGARGHQVLVLQRRTRARRGHVHDRNRGELYGNAKEGARKRREARTLPGFHGGYIKPEETNSPVGASGRSIR